MFKYDARRRQCIFKMLPKAFTTRGSSAKIFSTFCLNKRWLSLWKQKENFKKDFSGYLVQIPIWDYSLQCSRSWMETVKKSRFSQSQGGKHTPWCQATPSLRCWEKDLVSWRQNLIFRVWKTFIFVICYCCCYLRASVIDNLSHLLISYWWVIGSRV